MTTFTERASDYLGPTVTVTPRHAPIGERTFTVCGRDGCDALVASDESHRSLVHGDVEYAGRHQWNVRGNGGWNVRRRSPLGGAR